MKFSFKNKEGKLNKRVAIPFAILLMIGLGVGIYAISANFATLHSTATTGEPIFVSTDNGVTFNPLISNILLPAQSALIFPGETAPLSIVYIENAANVSEPIYLSMNNTNNTVDGGNWTTNLNGSALDGRGFLVPPGINKLVVTTTYSGVTPGAELDTIINIGGTLQINGTVIMPVNSTNSTNPTNSTNSTNVTTPSLVNLGAANDFALLSKSGITASGLIANAIIGNVGTSPISGAAMTGFDHTNVNGIIYTVDSAGPSGSISNPAKLGAAVADMQTAYTNANALNMTPGDLNIGNGNLAGLTLTPGVYKWNSNVVIPGNVTLDAQGNSSAIWVFQISGTLDISDFMHVNLINGANANNIYWIVSGTSVLEVGSVFNGNILDATNIATQTGSTLNGRALAQTAVTLLASNINQ
jgi:hypothetical protein